jgi:succinyl-CoA:(S)-malate CoA-transferase subunit A
MSGVRSWISAPFSPAPTPRRCLGEFGAELLKVEHPIAGDPMRRFGTPSPRADATLASG